MLATPFARLIARSPVRTAPAWASSPPPHCLRVSFSTSPAHCKRTRDNSRNRGVSSLYRSGPRQMLSVSNEELPQPSDYSPTKPGVGITTDDSHGLWGFFPRPHTLLNTPEEDAQHGRAWQVQELRQKSWDDLHALWWQCVKERNRLSTAARERRVSKIGFGDAEGDERDAEVRKTMRRIKHTLLERYYAWEDATELAKSDPDIDLTRARGGRRVRPEPVVEDDVFEEGAADDGREGASARA